MTERCLDEAVRAYEYSFIHRVNFGMPPAGQKDCAFSPRAHEAVRQMCSVFLTLVEQRRFRRLSVRNEATCYMLGEALCRAVQWGMWAESFIETAEEAEAFAKVEQDGPPWLDVNTAFELDDMAAQLRPLELEYYGTGEIHLPEEGDED